MDLQQIGPGRWSRSINALYGFTRVVPDKGFACSLGCFVESGDVCIFLECIVQLYIEEYVHVKSIFLFNYK
jgi:hypothetical protein